MVTELEHTLTQNGLERVISLEEVAESGSFLVDTNLAVESFKIYPVIHNRTNLTHNLLNLFGVHWRYNVKAWGLDDLEQEGGDTELVFKDIHHNRKTHRHAVYAFTENYRGRNQSLFLFVPDTLGWEYYQGILVPRFEADYHTYQEMKKSVVLGKA